jgi:hypothetical protein
MKIIDIRGQISHPFNWEYFKSLGSVHGRLGEHRCWELEHTFYARSLFDFELSWSTREDHAGASIGLGLLGYGVHFSIYNTRHWDYGNNSYATQ